MNIVPITDDAGAIVQAGWLVNAEAVHRQLRTSLPADYEGKMRRVFAGGGRMLVALRNDTVHGVAVYRIHENTFYGRQLYVDDLVTDEAGRSGGIGRALMQHIEGLARAAACDTLTLDSGTQRQDAHRFYFREGMTITSFHFMKRLK